MNENTNTTSNSSAAKRVRLNLQVDMRKNYWRKSRKVSFLNISQTGAFIMIPKADLSVDEKLSFKLNVGNRTRSIEAKVVWHNEFGAGIHFVFKSQRDMQMIDDLMYFIEAGKEDQKAVLHNIIKKVA